MSKYYRRMHMPLGGHAGENKGGRKDRRGGMGNDIMRKGEKRRGDRQGEGKHVGVESKTSW
jgi:hypothetical protein